VSEEHKALNELLLKLQSQRKQFDELPNQGAIDIIEEAVLKLLLLPESRALEKTALVAAEAMLMGVVPPPFNALGPLAIKGVTLLLDNLVAWAEARAKLSQV
jgi:hypothetical protein